jgi:hypothetical protein
VAIETVLQDPAAGPAPDRSLFVVPLAGPDAFITLPRPDRTGQIALVFTSAFRAADYARTLLRTADPPQYLACTPEQVVRVLQDLARAGVGSFVVDRCPRCDIATVLGNNGQKGVADVLKLWAIWKATEFARGELYESYALRAARDGDLLTALDVTLEAIGHIAMDEPRRHLLLGELAIGLGDRPLVGEARAFLRFLNRPDLDEKLAEDERAGRPDLDGQARPLAP